MPLIVLRLGGGIESGQMDEDGGEVKGRSGVGKDHFPEGNLPTTMNTHHHHCWDAAEGHSVTESQRESNSLPKRPCTPSARAAIPSTMSNSHPTRMKPPR